MPFWRRWRRCCLYAVSSPLLRHGTYTETMRVEWPFRPLNRVHAHLPRFRSSTPFAAILEAICPMVSWKVPPNCSWHTTHCPTDNTMAKKKKDGEPSPWKDSRAKMLLQQDILDGQVTASMKPQQVFEMRAEYKPYGIKRFRSNLYSLCLSTKENQGKADSDSAALVHDPRIHPKAVYTPKGYPRWDG